MQKPQLILIDNFVENPQALFELLVKDVKWDERMRARKTASFGVSYDYSGITYPQCDMHPVALTTTSL